MKKIVLCVSLALASAFAEGFFVGVSGGYAFTAVSEDKLAQATSGFWVENEIGDKEVRFNALSYGAKLGYAHSFSDKHALKAYLDYSRAAASKADEFAKDLSYDIASLNADYHYNLTPEFSVFAGLSAGNAWLNTKGSYGNESAFGYGVNVGVDYDISELLELEARFRYFDSNLREKTFLAGSEATRVEPDDFSQIMLGVNFKF